MPDQRKQHGRILVVEDEGIVATDIERCLEDAGFEVTGVAASAEDALMEASRDCPDLVLMDIRIQGNADGIEAGHELHQRYGLGIVYLTAHGDQDTIVRAKKTEPLAFVLKPFKPAELTHVIEIALNRSRADKEVRERERSFLSAMQSVGDAVLTIDGDGNVRFMNLTAEALTGWTQAQALGQPVTEVVRIVPEQMGGSADRFWAQLSPDEKPGFEASDPYCLLARGGEHRWVTARTASIVRSDSGRVLVVVLQDITRRRETEQALHRQADLLDQSFEPIYTWDRNGAIGYWNHGAEQLYGFTRQEAVGRNVHELLQTTHPSGLAAFKAAIERDGRWSGELTQTTKDGWNIVVESLMVAAEELSGGRTVLVTNRDITQRKRAEADMFRLNAELEQRVAERTEQVQAANRELEAFAYSVSHDLRAPLRGIDGWSLALLEDYGGQLDERGHEFLGRVRSEAQRMGLLIDDLLHLSRVNRAEMEHGTVDLSRTVDAIVARLREANPDRRIEFLFEPGLTAEGDTRLLDIALTNLLANAVKFTGPRPLSRIEFGQTEQNGERVFFVRDNGVGFDMAHAGILFAPFQRLHKASEFPGTGIGLATVQRVIHRHGGRVWAEAGPEAGAAFYFTIGGSR